MEGLKLIDASEVKAGRKKSKEIKKIPTSTIKLISQDETSGNIDKSPDVIKPDVIKPDVIKPDVIKPDIVKPDIVKPDIVKPDIVKPDIVKPDIVRPDIVRPDDIKMLGDVASEVNAGRIIRAIKLKEDIYYGPKNANKNKFMRMYKKLGLRWEEEVSLNDEKVDGWFLEDKSQYIIKLLEDGGFKRFKFYGCDEIYDYFTILGGVQFDYKVSNVESIKKIQVGVANKSDVGSTVGGTVNVEDNDEVYKFIGADLWSGFRTRQMLKKMPDNWGVKWN